MNQYCERNKLSAYLCFLLSARSAINNGSGFISILVLVQVKQVINIFTNAAHFIIGVVSARLILS
ncbi:hypothetical protein C3B55_00138 [Candidatus Pseudomonas adelgestsugas]|uniref:Uncharacterized protein n=1 Tax=Candidatus Pseudomonas adelgestsugas TaxID=1302376 RepID=A0ABX5R774_9PSED|nr:hypothetical protein C3B55_00138 [Candidatus Pseudomonas adelgestsugas]